MDLFGLEERLCKMLRLRLPYLEQDLTLSPVNIEMKCV
jgi:hypothetical protein